MFKSLLSEVQYEVTVPTVADRLLQKAVARILEAVFEADFCDVSYGYRPGRSPHHALRALRVQIVTKKVSHLFEADIRGFFMAWSFRHPRDARIVRQCPLMQRNPPKYVQLPSTER